MPEMPEKKLTVSASPHVRSAQTVSGIMLNVIIALIPALAASVWLFGPRVLLICLVTIGTCMLSEYLSRKIMKRSNTLGDLSAVVTGLLLAFNLPVSIPLWQAAIGSVIAIVVVKQLFGGIGQNFVNPAITGRIILMVSFPTAMTTWIKTLSWLAHQSQGQDNLRHRLRSADLVHQTLRLAARGRLVLNNPYEHTRSSYRASDHPEAFRHGQGEKEERG